MCKKNENLESDLKCQMYCTAPKVDRKKCNTVVVVAYSVVLRQKGDWRRNHLTFMPNLSTLFLPIWAS